VDSALDDEPKSIVQLSTTPPLPADSTLCRFSLHFGVYSSSQVLQINGRLYQVAPASHHCRRSYEQQGPLAPRALLRFIATTGPTATVSSSTDFPVDAGYTIYLAPPISRRDEDGFSSCLALPCHRAAPTTPPERIDASVRFRRSMLPSLRDRKLGLRSKKYRGHLWVHFRCGPVTRSPP